MPNRLLVVGRAECDHMPLQINRFWAELSIFSCIQDDPVPNTRWPEKMQRPLGRMRALCEYDAERETAELFPSLETFPSVFEPTIPTHDSYVSHDFSGT